MQCIKSKSGKESGAYTFKISDDYIVVKFTSGIEE